MSIHREQILRLPKGGTLTLGRTARLMGILNVTPDSFSDGGAFEAVDQAVAQTRRMLAEGADIIDIGGESTRPDAVETDLATELGRVVPVIEAMADEDDIAILSIDTYKAEVAALALDAGASIVNDVHGLQREPEIAVVAAERGAPVIAMHWDKERDRTRDLIGEVRRYFDRTLEIADRAGVPRGQLVLDAGFGFGKSLAENYELLRRLPELAELGYPMLVGTSRKSMIGRVLGVPTGERLAGTIATSVLGYMAGGQLFRVHDVGPNRDALRVAEAALYGPEESTK